MPPAKAYYVFCEQIGAYGFKRRFDAEAWISIRSGLGKPKIRKVNHLPLAYRIRIGEEVWYMTPSTAWLRGMGWGGVLLDGYDLWRADNSEPVDPLLACPNTPPCPHPDLGHEYDSLGVARCCAQDCPCGHGVPAGANETTPTAGTESLP